ncbi:PLP-dependent aminotransferase family protein [Streptomyces sp. KCTC 0041BP]|uniref:MocR-like pyridoxine biosynthesis transcription factor PdxR n=1 Tax=Streptomyces sp. KCTC 0041BP TaxID=201500 RepID=UPI001AE5399A|nr:PLP-dependent aminotransferase family protein [Streptomyces sp. KCTC 0041BP]MBP0932113.1 PLP-dependent aminotransferase family protein [Streptomyces sp. KCTC 0041BP]
MSRSWVNSAERIGADLHLVLAGTGSRRAALAQALREAIQEGRLAAGVRLPPYRSLAADLGIARNTAADAYAELVAEGWLTARQGSGTRVAERAAPARAVRAPVGTPTGPAAPAHNLAQGRPDASSFPRTAWATSARRALTAAPHDAFGPGDPQGRIELRTALADYLARVRGVRTSPERIVICAGFSDALRLLFGGGVLRGPLAVEAYGLAFHRALLGAEGVRTVPLGMDGLGTRTEELRGRRDVRSVLLTPAHQFPVGGPLSAARRGAAVDWARARGGVVIEDDYDGEFRYDREPIGAVQALDPDHVLYVGSAAKSVSPALRLGWMVLPERLVAPVLAAKGLRERWTGVVDQLTFADLIASGAYDRHVRQMRQRYRDRRGRLVAALAEHAPHIEVTGIAAGLHAVLRLPPGTETAALDAASLLGLGLDGLAGFRHPDTAEALFDGLVVGYAAPPDHAYAAALDALCTILPPVQRRASSRCQTGLSK